MHFVKLASLAARGVYFYSVQSGASNATISKTFSFRAPYGGGETRIALYGDMGVYEWNNMANLEQDCVKDKAMDLIVHAGDHCYNEGDADERRMDGYMEAFQQTVANVPWMPIVGNHEYYASTNLTRYLDSTWEKWGPLPGGEEWGNDGRLAGATSATSSLGAFLSLGNHHSLGVHGAVPSKTSRYFSADFGLVHLVALSLNGYNGVDTCTTTCNRAQLAWLKADLAAVDRAKTPWVVAMSHFPLYTTEKASAEDDEPLAPKAWLNAEQCEFEGHSRTCRPAGWHARNDEGLTLNNARTDLEPIFDEFGVDIYWAGHIHFYQTFHGPLRGGKLVSNGTVNPHGVIHVCSGNGGPPGPSKCPQTAVYKTCISQPYSYTRLTVHNATDLTWAQVSNDKSEVIDSWTLHQDSHGPFQTGVLV